jgi:hypothetical protein
MILVIYRQPELHDKDWPQELQKQRGRERS